MKLLPLFLHIFRNSPVCIPKTIFQTIVRIILAFLWGGGHHVLNCKCCNSPEKRRLAVPNFSRYFLVGQLVLAHRWMYQPDHNATVTLEAAVVGSYEALSYLLYQRRAAPYPLTESMARVPEQRGVSTYPLWHNPTTPIVLTQWYTYFQ